jgi:hypothetical protein
MTSLIVLGFSRGIIHVYFEGGCRGKWCPQGQGYREFPFVLGSVINCDGPNVMIDVVVGSERIQIVMRLMSTNQIASRGIDVSTCQP